MKRTTLKLDESVLRRLKQQAAAGSVPASALDNGLGRRGLATCGRDPYSLELGGWADTLQRGVDRRDRDALSELMHGR